MKPESWEARTKAEIQARLQNVLDDLHESARVKIGQWLADNADSIDG
jgi:hypothetical protein